MNPIKIAFDPDKLKLVDPKTLIKDPKNRNKHPQAQIDRFCKLLQEYGMRWPILVSERTGVIKAGEGRLLAALQLGMPEVLVSYQEFENETLEYGFGISDNAIASWADLDLAGINTDIGDLGPFDIDLLGIEDFTVTSVEKLEPQCDEDEVPEHVETRTKLGDIYVLGKHRLLCGDSTSIDAVEMLMNGEKADMVFTDPPYGYKYESNYQDKHEMLKNDDKILDFLPCAFSAMKEDSCIYLFGSHQTIHKWRDLIDQSFEYKNLIVWKKNNWSMGDLKGAYAGQHELILFAHKGRVELRGDRSRDIWEFDRDPPKDHPTQKPIPLIEFAIDKSSDTSMNIMDLFGGSGSTMIACEKTNRKCFMMELDPHYCDVIVARWEKYTGKKAELVQ